MLPITRPKHRSSKRGGGCSSALSRLFNKRRSARTVTAAAAALICIFLLLDMYNWGMVMPHITYHKYRQRWVHMLSTRDWKRIAGVKSALPRYEPPSSASGDFPFFPVKVLSLQRSKERRAHVAAQLAAHNLPFQFVDALDGDQPLPEEEVLQYVSGTRLAKYRRQTPNARYKVACDLSHFRLMHSMLGAGHSMQLVLEDDFLIPETVSNLIESLNRTMHALPADWDMLHLNLCLATLQGEVGPGIRVYSRGFCTLGFIYTRRAALKVLHEAEKGSRNVDNIIMDLVAIGELASYVADPPLIVAAESFASEIDKGDGEKDPF